ncbi:hypothetical protein [Methylobacterium nigriterrae]|uniref:hypothetical protein n=1 Tax=Methylobacterium nigriterrae TaxID=3127512 RepID=UPI003014173A
MSLIHTSLARAVRLALASGCLVILAAAHAHAADEGGLGGLFQRLFSSETAPATPPSSAPAVQIPASGFEDGDGQHQARSAHHRSLRDLYGHVRPKVRYAALPRPEKVRSAATEKARAAENKSAALARAGEPNAALLQDATLRKGDIVITAEGPKVFTGRAKEHRTAGDFEEASRSPGLDRKTRELLAAMVAPRGALPADEARKLVAKLAHPAEQTPTSVAVQAEAAPLRVVCPSTAPAPTTKVSLQGH